MQSGRRERTTDRWRGERERGGRGRRGGKGVFNPSKERKVL